jgi:hypothetical protein
MPPEKGKGKGKRSHCRHRTSGKKRADNVVTVEQLAETKVIMETDPTTPTQADEHEAQVVIMDTNPANPTIQKIKRSNRGMRLYSLRGSRGIHQSRSSPMTQRSWILGSTGRHSWDMLDSENSFKALV